MNNIAKILAAIAIGAASLAAGPAGATDFTVVGQSRSAGVHFAKIEMVSSAGATEPRVIKFSCDRGVVSSAWIESPRDVSSGMSSGKRMHKPMSVTYEWSAVTLAVPHGSWDLATSKGARSSGGISAMDDWTAITVTGLDEACSSGAAASVGANPLYQDAGTSGTNPVAKADGGAMPVVTK